MTYLFTKGNTLAKKEPNIIVLGENTIEIKLTKGFKTIIDSEDYEKVKEHRWCAAKDGNTENTYYAMTRIRIEGKSTTIKLHTLLMDIPEGFIIDHIDRDGLNNRKSNLRLVTHSQNMQNRKLNRNSTSGEKGVYWSARSNKWKVNIQSKKKRYYGTFETKEAAIEYRNELVKNLHGDYGRLQ